MPSQSTDEENAQKILEIFAHFDAEPGHELLITNFVAAGKRQRWEMTDLQQGLDLARKKKWIDYKEGSFRLTEEGFSAIRVKA